ncbi:MAG TPA: exosome complex RNA-binding protein Rrp4 [Thermoplasmata archaeon]|nr:exosome complex RNA-binding protein Rrp4 [Thermoplasmata archaeon]
MQQNGSGENVREIVVPGDLLSESGLKAGPGTYVESGRIYAAQLGIKTTRSNVVGVVPLSGQYIPMRGDMVIGKIVDMGASNWYVDINAAHQSSLHVNEVPWRVEFGETGKFMTVGDLVSLKVVGVDELGKVQISMKEHGLRKLAGGVVVEVAPAKIPRVIGRSGSMIQMLKNATSCRIYVGQNGRIWVDGDLDSMLKAIDAIKLIETEAHSVGLTQKVEKLLGQKVGKGE